MLLNISKHLKPQLYDILYKMGHGDRLVIADANFPAASNARNLCLMPGISACEALDLVLKYIPVDTFIEFPVEFMAVAEGDDYQPDIWEDFDAILEKQAGFKPGCRYLSRSEFYQEARNSYAVICTGENRRYGNIIISKGVIES